MHTAKQCRKCGLTAEEFMEMMKAQETADKEQKGDKPAE
jgi:hypothetical protein